MRVQSPPVCVENTVLAQIPKLKSTLQGHPLWRSCTTLCCNSQFSKTKTLAITAISEDQHSLLS